MKYPVSIIALDLDDTLLKADLSISDYTVGVLNRAAIQGIYIVLCSGRTENAILPYVRRLNLAGLEQGRYIIASNGSSVYDMHQRKQIYSRTVEPDILVAACREAKKRGLFTEVYDASTIYVPEANKWTDLDTKLSSLNQEVVPDYEAFLQNKAHPKMVIPGEPEALAEFLPFLRDLFGDRCVLFTSKPYFLEILPKNTGKGEAMEWLSGALNIPHKKTMAFGDSMNDESMIKYAYHSVAMMNGLDYIKQLAAHVTERTNEADGVADFIDRNVL